LWSANATLLNIPLRERLVLRGSGALVFANVLGELHISRSDMHERPAVNRVMKLLSCEKAIDGFFYVILLLAHGGNSNRVFSCCPVATTGQCTKNITVPWNFPFSLLFLAILPDLERRYEFARRSPLCRQSRGVVADRATGNGPGAAARALSASRRLAASSLRGVTSTRRVRCAVVKRSKAPALATDQTHAPRQRRPMAYDIFSYYKLAPTRS
jgi:hypothetical protein